MQGANEQVAENGRADNLVREGVYPDLPRKALALEKYVLRLRPLHKSWQRSLLEVRVEHEHGARGQRAGEVAIRRKWKLGELVRHERGARRVRGQVELRGVKQRQGALVACRT